MRQLYIGLDTSCYTTSIACVDEEGIVLDERTMLDVQLGEKGLRQSEAVFRHVLNLKRMIPAALAGLDKQRIRCIAVSVKPRDYDDSYMPVFISGQMAAATLACALQVPLLETSHQQGHISAALVGNEAIKGKSVLALHLSGGTTEILSFDPIKGISLIGGSQDLHAGQLVDRIGVKLGFGFPAGPHLERMAQCAGDTGLKIPSSVNKTACSFSGAETFAYRLIESGEKPEDIAYAIFDCISRTIAKLILNTAKRHGISDILLAGGVASSGLLRKMLQSRLKSSGLKLFFAAFELSKDNAVGNAILAREWDARNEHP